MKVKDYILQKFQSFGIQLSEADLFDITLNISGEGEMNEDNHAQVNVAITKFIPSLLLYPNISESGFSLTIAQRDSIMAFYSWACKEYGLDDVLSNKPKVTFL